MDEALNASSTDNAVSLRSLAATWAGDAKDNRGAHARRPHLWVLVVPLIVGCCLVSLHEFYSTVEVVRESHLSVFIEAAHNGAAALNPFVDSAVVASRAANAHFQAREADIGTPAADAALLDLLAAFPKVSILVVALGSGQMSGAGRLVVRCVAVRWRLLLGSTGADRMAFVRTGRRSLSKWHPPAAYCKQSMWTPTELDTPLRFAPSLGTRCPHVHGTRLVWLPGLAVPAGRPWLQTH